MPAYVDNMCSEIVSGEFGRVGRVFLAALQNSKFFSKWGYFYTFFKCF